MPLAQAIATCRVQLATRVAENVPLPPTVPTSSSRTVANCRPAVANNLPTQQTKHGNQGDGRCTPLDLGDDLWGARPADDLHHEISKRRGQAHDNRRLLRWICCGNCCCPCAPVVANGRPPVSSTRSSRTVANGRPTVAQQAWQPWFCEHHSRQPLF